MVLFAGQLNTNDCNCAIQSHDGDKRVQIINDEGKEIIWWQQRRHHQMPDAMVVNPKEERKIQQQ